MVWLIWEKPTSNAQQRSSSWNFWPRSARRSRHPWKSGYQILWKCSWTTISQPRTRCATTRRRTMVRISTLRSESCCISFSSWVFHLEVNLLEELISKPLRKHETYLHSWKTCWKNIQKGPGQQGGETEWTTYNYVNEASRALGVNSGDISRMCQKAQKTA